MTIKYYWANEKRKSVIIVDENGAGKLVDDVGGIDLSLIEERPADHARTPDADAPIKTLEDRVLFLEQEIATLKGDK